MIIRRQFNQMLPLRLRMVYRAKFHDSVINQVAAAFINNRFVNGPQNLIRLAIKERHEEKE
jgi:hypothetical protein